MVTLDVNIQGGQIGIHQTSPQISMDIKAPDLNLQIKQPELILDITYPEITHIDEQNFLRELGYPNYVESARQEAQDARASALRAIERTVRQGYRMADITRRGEKIAKIAAEVPTREKQLTVDMVPHTPPAIDVRLGTITGHLLYGRVGADLIPGDLNYSAQLGQTDIYLEKAPSIEMTAKGLIFDHQA